MQKTGKVSKGLLIQLYRAAGKGAVKNGRIYVRRNQKPLFDVAVAISRPRTPLGTHHFTAISNAAHKNAQNEPEKYWLALSIEQTGWQDRDETNYLSASDAHDAINRFILPEKLRRRISDLIVPGSTVVIADQGLSHETGKGTDFIVLTK